MDISPFLVGASIPLITIVINRIFDLIFIKKNHKLSISKEYFIKKIEAFEKTTAHYTIAHLSLSHMSLILKTIIKPNVGFDEDTVKNMLTEIQKHLKYISTLSPDIALSIPLYTDMNLPDGDELYIEKYLEQLGEINLIGTVIEKYEEMIKNTKYPIAMQKFAEKRDDKIKELEEKVLSLHEISKTIREKFKLLTSSLRRELKIYEIDKK